MVQVIQGGVTVGALSVVRQGYVDNINNAELLKIPDISTLTATVIARLDDAITSRVKFVDHHDYQTIANSATYTPTAQVIGLFMSEWKFSGMKYEFYDGGGWVGVGLSADQDAGAKYFFQDNAQNVRIINSSGSTKKIAINGVVWS